MHVLKQMERALPKPVAALRLGAVVLDLEHRAEGPTAQGPTLRDLVLLRATKARHGVGNRHVLLLGLNGLRGELQKKKRLGLVSVPADKTRFAPAGRFINQYS